MDTYGLLGRNISYSLSPTMHNAAFKHYGISAHYKLFSKEEDELDSFFTDEVLSGKIKGFNVTVPYKIKTQEFLSSRGFELDKWVEATGALNTVKINDGELTGYNTDVHGFYASVEEDLGLSFTDEAKKTIFVAGAGGAGRAIALFMAHMPIKKVYVFDVSGEQLDSLKEAFNACDESVCAKFYALRDQEQVASKAEESDLIINATPLGTHEGSPSPVPVDVLREGQAVYDLVYARETELLQAAKEKGLKCANGLGMLVNQAAKAFEIWTGKPFSEIKDIMRKAANVAIANK